MPKIHRCDIPGSWHYVTNEGQYRQMLFKRAADARNFLSQLARVHRSGLMEIHAYAVLRTRFRLLVRSPAGRLSEAMQIVQRSYVYWYKRNYRHDGPLFPKRFYSYCINDEELWISLVRYIDQESPNERIDASGRHNLFGSALHYRKVSGPPWLTRGTVENKCQYTKQGEAYEPRGYLVPFGLPFTFWDRRFIYQNLKHRDSSHFPVNRDYREELLSEPQNNLLRRLTAGVNSDASSKSASPAKDIIISPVSILDCIKEQSRSHPNWIVRPHCHRKPGWRILEAGLLRMIGGLRFREIGRLINCSEVKARRMYLFHEKLFQKNPHYFRQASLISRMALKMNQSLDSSEGMA